MQPPRLHRPACATSVALCAESAFFQAVFNFLHFGDAGTVDEFTAKIMCVFKDFSTLSGLFVGYMPPAILLGAISCVALARGWGLCRLDRMPAWRVSKAATDWLLFSYSTLCSITLRLLHCVPIGGGGSYLFLTGATECFTGWQGALIVVVVVLFLLPLALFRFLHFHPLQSVMAAAAVSPMAAPSMESVSAAVESTGTVVLEPPPPSAADPNHQTTPAAVAGVADTFSNHVFIQCASAYRSECRAWTACMLLQLMIFSVLCTFITEVCRHHRRHHHHHHHQY